MAQRGRALATNPSRATCDLIDRRDQFSCVRCGASINGGSRHHRKLRRHGDHTAANLILLCGSGTTGCHGWVHANVLLSYKQGWLIHSWHSSTEVPILVRGRGLLLNIEGQIETMNEAEAAARMTELGLD